MNFSFSQISQILLNGPYFVKREKQFRENTKTSRIISSAKIYKFALGMDPSKFSEKTRSK